MAIRNPEAGEIIRSMRKDLSRDITEFINLHAPELGIDGNSTATSSTSSSNNHSSANSVQVSRSNSDANLQDQRNSESSSSTSFLEASISTTTDDMPESYLVSSRDESFLEYSSTDELNESKYHVESIVLNEDEDEEEAQSSPLSQI